MTSLAPADIVWVPFPFVEEARRRNRPALIIASGLGPDGALCWAMMITSARRPDWPGDIVLDDHAALGLPIPSKVRTAKMATIEAREAHKLGRLNDTDWQAVSSEITRRVSEIDEP